MRTILAMAIAFGLAFQGCFAHTYEVAGTTTASDPRLSRWHSRLFFGLVELSDPIELRSVCPEGISRVDNRVTFLTGLVGLATAFLYAPSKEQVFCQIDDVAKAPSEAETAPRAVVMPGPVDQ